MDKWQIEQWIHEGLKFYEELSPEFITIGIEQRLSLALQYATLRASSADLNELAGVINACFSPHNYTSSTSITKDGLSNINMNLGAISREVSLLNINLKDKHAT